MMSRFVLSCCAALAVSGPSLAGDLDPPPGPVAPTMKTLTDVEPRTAINAENTPGNATTAFIISTPGSYYLTENLSVPSGTTGILVTTDDVTIDLMGFTISSSFGGASADGINADNRDRIHIRNGRVRIFTDDGVVVQDEARLENLDVTNCQGDGFSTGSSSIVSDCTAVSNTGRGFVFINRCVVERCTARSNGSTGFAQTSGCILRDCLTNLNGGPGYTSGADAMYERCQSINDTGAGFFGTSDATLTDCVAESAGTIGFDFDDRLAARGCRAVGNDGDGFVAGQDASFVGCVSSNNGLGFSVGNYATIDRCAAYDNLSTGVSATGLGGVFRDSVFNNNGSSGIFSNTLGTVTGCYAEGNGSNGFEVRSGAVVRGCSAVGNGFTGISAQSGCTIDNCTSRSNDGGGISCGNDCRVFNNHCLSNTSAGAAAEGIRAGSDCRIDSNSCHGNDIGFDINGTGNIVVRNTARSNATDYSIVGGNDVGTIQLTPVGAGAWDNFVH